MTEAIILGWIGTISTFLTVVGAIVKQGMTLKKTIKVQETIKKDTAETRQISEEMRVENKGGFEDLKTLVVLHIDFITDQIATMSKQIEMILATIEKDPAADIDPDAPGYPPGGRYVR